ncbi:MAG TPA: AAA family ATPase [Saprospiraceae bacterium]|nr:AAA family ATPase [Saprospiraceae bacterium]HMQ84566.1 AAA family ATPase [Saprospiraceae bacterium]
MIIPRKLAAHLQELGKYFPIISLTGPRQAGKTTLLQQLFSEYRYVSFEDPEYRARFESDARSFLAQYDRYVIFDEAPICFPIYRASSSKSVLLDGLSFPAHRIFY